MNNQLPLISIIIPTYNRENLIAETLKSILNQTYSNWECIVVDDGSIDDTENIVSKFEKEDSRFKFIKRPQNRKKGACSCRNYGLEQSKGKYINWLDSDDLLDANKLSYSLPFLDKDIIAVISNGYRFEKNYENKTRNWRESIYDQDLVESLINQKVGWQTAFPLWNKKYLPNKPFNEELPAGQEWEFHIKFVSKMRNQLDKFFFIEKELVYIRVDNISISRSKKKDSSVLIKSRLSLLTINLVKEELELVCLSLLKMTLKLSFLERQKIAYQMLKLNIKLKYIIIASLGRGYQYI